MNSQSHDRTLVAQLDALEGQLASFIAENPDDTEFWKSFDSESKLIRAVAAPQDAKYAQGRLDCMLKNAGMIPGGDEGEPCK